MNESKNTEVPDLNNSYSLENINLALINACEEGDLESVDELFSMGANINFKDEDSNTPLMAAINNEQIHVVRYLLNMEVDINYRDELDNTPLIKACELELISVVKWLLNLGADVTAQNNKGHSASYVAQFNNELLVRLKAAEKNSLTIPSISSIKMAAKSVAEVQFNSETDIVPLSKKLCKYAKSKILTQNILFEYFQPINVNVYPDSNSLYNPLLTAVSIDSELNTATLLNAGANPNAYKKDTLHSCLHFACAHYSLKTIRLLLERGGDIDFQNINGLTPLGQMLTPEIKQIHIPLIIKILQYIFKNNEPNLNLRDLNGKTLLHKLCEAKIDVSKLMTIIITNGAKINIQDKLGNTPMHYAIKQNQPANVSCLLNYAACVNLTDNKNTSPLVLALNQTTVSKTIVNTLLSIPGINVNSVSKIYGSAIYSAAKLQDESLMTRITEKGIDSNNIGFPTECDVDSKALKQLKKSPASMILNNNISPQRSNKKNIDQLIAAIKQNLKESILFWGEQCSDADLLTQDEQGLSPIAHLIIHSRKNQSLSLLKDFLHKNLVNKRINDKEQTILHMAADTTLGPIWPNLIIYINKNYTKHVNINTLDKHKQTAAHCSLTKGVPNNQILKLLFECGSDFLITDENDNDVLTLIKNCDAISSLLYLKKLVTAQIKLDEKKTQKIDTLLLAAKLHLFLKEHKEANNYCQKALQNSNNSQRITAYIILARLNVEEKQYNEAQEYLQKISKLNPENCQTNAIISECHFEQKATDKAFTFANKSLELNPLNFDALMLRLQIHNINKDHEKMRQDINAAIKLAPNNIFIYLFYAETLDTDEKSLSQTLEWINKAAKINPDSCYMLATRAKIFFKLRKKDDSLNDLSHAINFIQTNNLSSYYEKSRKFYSELYLLRGNIFLEKDDFEDSEKDLLKSLQLDSQNPKIYFSLGTLCLKCGQFQQARNYFDKTIEASPTDAYLYLQRALTLQEKIFKTEKCDSTTQASFVADIKKAITLNPNLPEAYFWHAKYLTHVENTEEALSAYDKSIQCNSNFAPSHCEKAKLTLKTDPQLSLKILNKAEPYLNDYANYKGDYYFLRAQARRYIAKRTNDEEQTGALLSKAIEDMKTSIKVKPKGEKYYILALLYRTEYKKFNPPEYSCVKDYSELYKIEHYIGYLTKALNLHPNIKWYYVRAKAYDDLGHQTIQTYQDKTQTIIKPEKYSYKDTEHLTQAIKDYTETIKLDSTHMKAYIFRARLYLEQKKYNLALADFKAVANLKENKFHDFHFIPKIIKELENKIANSQNSSGSDSDTQPSCGTQ